MQGKRGEGTCNSRVYVICTVWIDQLSTLVPLVNTAGACAYEQDTLQDLVVPQGCGSKLHRDIYAAMDEEYIAYLGCLRPNSTIETGLF
jgi:hypothetical protein